MADTRTPRQLLEWDIMYLCSHEIEAGKILAQMERFMDPSTLGGSPHLRQNATRAGEALRLARKLVRTLETVESCWRSLDAEIDKPYPPK